ncbi:MAG: hypothetical protein LBV62_00395 [Rickettsiales bacterium]|jgi:hypothetical protein|nr:hypothetical protein [Rickettsiales bacterium]
MSSLSAHCSTLEANLKKTTETLHNTNKPILDNFNLLTYNIYILTIKQEFKMSTLDEEGWKHVEKHECNESYKYNTRENINIFFNNTLASFSRSWKQFKEKA